MLFQDTAKGAALKTSIFTEKYRLFNQLFGWEKFYETEIYQYFKYEQKTKWHSCPVCSLSIG
jgi:hypothetical protein